MKKATVILFNIYFGSLFYCQRDQDDSSLISGAWALYPMMQVWAQEYQRVAAIKIEVTGGEGGKGISDVLNNQVDVAMCSRPIKKEEMELGAFYIAVTKDAVIAIVSSSNPILLDIKTKGLSRDILANIFMKNITEFSNLK